MATITVAAVVGASAAVVGAGVSIYGSQQSAAAQRQAAAANAALSKAQAQAQAQVSRYQANLNYASAMAQSAQQATNAIGLSRAAGTVEQQGQEAIARQVQQSQAQNSAATASYGASGVTGDEGSPVMVQAYNHGMQQLQRMDMAYQSNLKALDYDWQGTLANYQSQLTAETAKQFQYAQKMADWSEQTGIIGAGVQQQVANNNAFATEISGYSSALSDIGQAAGNLGYAYSRTPARGGVTSPTLGG
jgi:multidrug efflux pump subunit AcrA (membrane-fusion protein)